MSQAKSSQIQSVQIRRCALASCGETIEPQDEQFAVQIGGFLYCSVECCNWHRVHYLGKGPVTVADRRDESLDDRPIQRAATEETAATPESGEEVNHGDGLTSASQVITISQTSRGEWRFELPRKSDAFLNEFKARIGKPFRFWNTFKNSWDIKPIDRGMLELIAQIIERHYAIAVRIEAEAAPAIHPAETPRTASVKFEEKITPYYEVSNGRRCGKDVRVNGWQV